MDLGGLAEVEDHRRRREMRPTTSVLAGCGGTSTIRSAEFQLTYGDWIRLFRGNGFAVEDLIELRPPADADTTYVDYAPLDWARDFPAEHIWKVRKEPR